jgi:hypothetical protein
MTKAYVYRWTHLPTFKWYIGSRTRKGCHPNDGYICSSKIVEPLIIEKPFEWVREILFVGEPAEAFEYETLLLQLFDAKNNTQSFNKHNNDLKFNSIGKSYPRTEQQKRNQSEIMKGRFVGEKSPNFGIPRTDEVKLKISISNSKPNPNKSHPHTEEQKLKWRVMRKGISPINKGIQYPIVKCPHCNKQGGGSSMKRWHFDNCKLKEKHNGESSRN